MNSSEEQFTDKHGERINSYRYWDVYWGSNRIDNFRQQAKISPEAGALAFIAVFYDINNYHPPNQYLAFNMACKVLGYGLGSTTYQSKIVIEEEYRPEIDAINLVYKAVNFKEKRIVIPESKKIDGFHILCRRNVMQPEHVFDVAGESGFSFSGNESDPDGRKTGFVHTSEEVEEIRLRGLSQYDVHILRPAQWNPVKGIKVTGPAVPFNLEVPFF